MKLFFSYLSLAFLALILFLGTQGNNSKNSINPVIGDLSAFASDIENPNSLSESERIKTHLLYVESVLRNKPIKESKTLHKRHQLLDALLSYIHKGVFPKNYDYPSERKPCFIDRDGNICAVGYLVEQTAGRAVAEYINSKFQYDELLAMNDPTLDQWIENSGFSKRELAMIQPAYGGSYPQNELNREYGIATALLGGASLGINVINMHQINNRPQSKFTPIFGLITGASQLTLGLANYPNNVNQWGANYTNNTQRDVSILNIGLGTTTLFLSTWNLVSNRQPKEKKVSWNAFSYPTKNNQMTFGLSFSKRF